MFKLVVLSVLVAVAVAAPKPSHVVAYSAPVYAHSVAVAPAAVSHQSRVDIVSKPVVHTTYTAAAPLVAAPLAYPAVQTYAYGTPYLAHYAHAPLVAY